MFISSFYLPVSDDLELQANIALALSLILFAWLGARNYYSRYSDTPAYKLAFIMVAVAVILDVLITVPLLVIPVGGSYGSFFGEPGFWLIAVVYYLVIITYWYLKVRPASVKSIN